MKTEDEIREEIDRLESKLEAYNKDTRGWDIWYGARNALEFALDDD
jgi:hypothetical protein